MEVISLFPAVSYHVTFNPLQPRVLSLLHPQGGRNARAAFPLEARVLSSERHIPVVEKQEKNSAVPPVPSAVNEEKRKQKRKPRPNFCEQALRRWSVRIPSERAKFPWEEEQDKEKDEEEDDEERWRNHGDVVVDNVPVSVPPVSDNDFGRDFRPTHRAVSAPWVRANDERHKETPLRTGAGSQVSDGNSGFENDNVKGSSNSSGSRLENRVHLVDSSSKKGAPANIADVFPPKDHPSPTLPVPETKNMNLNIALVREIGAQRNIANPRTEKVKRGVNLIGERKESLFVRSISEFDAAASAGEVSLNSGTSHISVPWEREVDDKRVRRIERENTEKAERTLPEPELRRLRNDALRIKEFTKVGAGGVTEALVESIREKWKNVEVVKLRFEGPPAINMKRTHEILEGKTGGLVIWRSGRLVVLYRGMSYKLPCVQSYAEKIDKGNNRVNLSNNSNSSPRQYAESANLFKHLKKSKIKSSSAASFEQEAHNLMDFSEIDRLLDQLGPRFREWSGRAPLPVDADLLPQVVRGYKPPLRCLPYKVKQGLRDAETTYLRRLARSLPPHFALGRNRNHQGLAQAMVKLWKKSLIAKIAIKRGVLNTCNDRMAEELKRLTGGVLLSRNKEFIVFYRGNDFLTPSIAEAMEEREKLVDIRQDEEDQARQRASDLMVTRVSTRKGQLIAGTLAETAEAKIYWANEPSEEDRQIMMYESAMAKHASLIRYMERRLLLAVEKVKKAEKALADVQEHLEPADLPNDLETVTDEERSLFRKMGLKMKAFLSLGRRGVYDGTVENMHLHWKHRELVKVIVEGKSFAQIKHIAVSLEAESGGVLISLDKTTKGYAIVIYRGKNYERPFRLRPKNLLTRKQALARSIELQRREALKYHISDLRDKINTMKSELEQMKRKDSNDEAVNVDGAFSFNADDVEEEGEEAYLRTYNSDGEEDSSQ